MKSKNDIEGERKYKLKRQGKRISKIYGKKETQQIERERKFVIKVKFKSKKKLT